MPKFTKQQITFIKSKFGHFQEKSLGKHIHFTSHEQQDYKITVAYDRGFKPPHNPHDEYKWSIGDNGVVTVKRTKNSGQFYDTSGKLLPDQSSKIAKEFNSSLKKKLSNIQQNKKWPKGA